MGFPGRQCPTHLQGQQAAAGCLLGVQHQFSGLSTHYHVRSLQQVFTPLLPWAVPKRHEKPHVKTGKLRPKAQRDKTKTQAF